jgi:hypothetical protein
MSTGWEYRLESLKDDAERLVIGPIRLHGWTASISREVESGNYILIEARRDETVHKVALLYYAATSNDVYRSVASQVEHILVHGDADGAKPYIYGIDTPVTQCVDFHNLLVAWNAAADPGRVSRRSSPLAARSSTDRLLLSETPIEAIWLRLAQLGSVRLARALVAERALRAGVDLMPSVLDSKAEGVAFALRNAVDYYRAHESNISRRVISLYYGSMSFAFAEMLAGPTGPVALSEIESLTTRGHGLYTIDGPGEGLAGLVVGVIESGFFPSWVRHFGRLKAPLPTQKPKKVDDIQKTPAATRLTLEQLFARVPEVGDLFVDVFTSTPAWMKVHYQAEANKMPSFHPRNASPRPSTTYVNFVDESARMAVGDVAVVQGPIRELCEVESKYPGRHFRGAIDHPGKEYWHEALPIHTSPFARHCVILPLFGEITEYRAISVVLLYALSIVVRYRPGLWRRVQEGDLDHVRVLIEAYLAVVERVLPEEFLERITDRRVFAKQPGAW